MVNGIPTSIYFGATDPDLVSWVFATAFDRGSTQVIRTSGHEVFHQVCARRGLSCAGDEDAANLFGASALGQFSQLTDCNCGICR